MCKGFGGLDVKIPYRGSGNLAIPMSWLVGQNYENQAIINCARCTGQEMYMSHCSVNCSPSKASSMARDRLFNPLLAPMQLLFKRYRCTPITAPV